MGPEADQPLPVRIATRASRLAVAQARAVAEALPVPAEIVTISTRGDRAAGPLSEVGGKGLFTSELEALLRRGEVQLAVHSAKDLPAVLAEDMLISAVPPREDARDAVISPGGSDLLALPGAARVGTSSLRRAVQVRAVRPDLVIVPLRGNVETRIRKLHDGECEAVILAMAGLNRLGLSRELAEEIRPLPVERFVPAAGQGALAVQCLAADERARRIAAGITDSDSADALHAERRVVRLLGAGCHSAMGVHLWRDAARWRGAALVADPTSGKMIRPAVAASSAEEAAEELLARLAEAGAGELLGR